jgi:hypothetical protein
MANRFSQISTSSFKPLNLEEIMAVPLAKQAQHDEASLAMDEFAKLEANSLDQDKEYITSQIQALQGESDSISNQLLENGVDRNIVNKVKSLRNRKNQEFSLQGKTGQASAAYNEYKANEVEINKRTDMTAEMKKAGLAQAKADYLGVAEGGKYNAYTGTAYQDAAKKAYAIADAMTPQEKAQALGMTWDSENGFYVDGDRVHRELKAEHIQKVAYQGLKADTAMMEYANEYERLGMGSAEDMLSKAAVSAGNVYQVNDLKKTVNYRSGGKNNKTFDDSANLRNPMDWSSKNYSTIQEQTYNEYAIQELPDRAYDEKGNIVDDFYESKEKMKARHNKELASKTQEVLASGLGSTAPMREAHWKELNSVNEKEEQVKRIQNFKNDFKVATEGMSDKEVYQVYSNLQQNASAYISEVSFPENPESTFNYIKERVLGEGDNSGDIMSGARQFHFPGEDKAITAAEIAERYDLDEVEMEQMMKKGTIGGISPYDPVLPMGFALQFSPDGENIETVIVSNDNKLKRLDQASRLTKNMLEGKSFDVQKMNTREGDVFVHYVLKLKVDRDPNTGEVLGQKYEPHIMYSKDEMKIEDLEGVSMEELENKGVEIFTMQETANHELQVAQRHYDGVINKKTLK